MRNKYLIITITFLSIIFTTTTTYYVFNNSNINDKYFIKANFDFNEYLKQIEIMKQNNLKQIQNLENLKTENSKLLNDVNNIRKTYLRLHTHMNNIGCISKNNNEPLPIVKKIIEQQEKIYRDNNLITKDNIKK